MDTRTKFFGMGAQERDAFFARDDIKEFLERVRSFKGVNRAVTGAELLIPDVVLPLVREVTSQQSKLLKYVSMRHIAGTARQPIMGAIPEAVWIEMTGTLNELELKFNQVDMDGYMVGGYVPIPNSVMDDSDVNLATEIINILGASIAKALDKAIIYGKGIKMPVGIVTRLAQQSQPANWPMNAPEWTDLHSTNILKLNIAASSGAEFFSSLIGAVKVAKPVYGSDGLFWVMNRSTHMDIMAKALAFNAAAALTAGVTNTMPVIGGDIVEMEDDKLPDSEIIGGYGANYLLAERQGTAIGTSEHAQFIQNNTVFKGYGRYDGTPVAGEAFVVVNYKNTDVTTAKDFPEDYANADMNVLTVTAAASSTASGKTVLTVSDTIAESNAVLKYKVKTSVAGINVGSKPGTGWTSLTSGTTEITAAAGVQIAVVELDAAGRVVSAGQVASVPKT